MVSPQIAVFTALAHLNDSLARAIELEDAPWPTPTRYSIAFEPLLATIQIIWEHMPHLSQALTMLRDAATAALPSNVEDDSSLAELLGDVDYAAEELALATEDMTAVREILTRYRLRVLDRSLDRMREGRKNARYITGVSNEVLDEVAKILDTWDLTIAEAREVAERLLDGFDGCYPNYMRDGENPD